MNGREGNRLFVYFNIVIKNGKYFPFMTVFLVKLKIFTINGC